MRATRCVTGLFRSMSLRSSRARRTSRTSGRCASTRSRSGSRRTPRTTRGTWRVSPVPDSHSWRWCRRGSRVPRSRGTPKLWNAVEEQPPAEVHLVPAQRHHLPVEHRHAAVVVEEHVADPGVAPRQRRSAARPAGCATATPAPPRRPVRLAAGRPLERAAPVLEDLVEAGRAEVRLGRGTRPARRGTGGPGPGRRPRCATADRGRRRWPRPASPPRCTAGGRCRDGRGTLCMTKKVRRARRCRPPPTAPGGTGTSVSRRARGGAGTGA